MSAKGINIAEELHVVNSNVPIDWASGSTGRYIQLEDYGHMSLIIALGAQTSTGGSATLLYEATSSTGENKTAIAFHYYVTSTGNDVFGTIQDATSTGLTTSATNNRVYCIELDASELDEGYKWVKFEITASTAAALGTGIAILSGNRYGQAASPTVLTD